MPQPLRFPPANLTFDRRRTAARCQQAIDREISDLHRLRANLDAYAQGARTAIDAADQRTCIQLVAKHPSPNHEGD